MGCFSSSIRSTFDNIYESDESLLMTDTKAGTPIQSTSPTPPEIPHPHPQPKPLGMTDIPIPKGWSDANWMSKTRLAAMAGDRNMPVHDIITDSSRLEFVFLFGDDFYSVNITSGEVYKILEPTGKKELWEMLEKDYQGIKCLTLVGNGASDDDSDEDS
ncbi:hypothetical protein JVT61DRAFT_1711 [Boletus reticuloceps]|uniref:Uncharacterized protein n=1 Tax=Boletus reticuloceps TaxID=495285 RepID=A0A8I3A9E2_9AGAM|nr:hypothetical protein JVT61DRAFT_1711 [Boletus reticuloceps]